MNPEKKKLIVNILTAVAIGGLGFFIVTFILQPFFSGSVVLPQFFGIGKIKIQFYGLILGLGALAGYTLAMRRKSSYKIPAEHADSIILAAIIFGFIGARVYHVLSEITFYIQFPSQIIAVWNGGLSIFGAAIGAVLAVFLYQKYFLKDAEPKTSFLNLLDWLTPSIIVGQIVGRFGNFMNYELYGYPTNLPWKMFVPIQFRTPPYELVSFFHPLFLYEAAGSALILVLVLKLKLRHGRLFLLWLLLYNVMRFFLEYLRVGSIVYGNIRINAIVAGILALIALALFLKLKKSESVDVIPNSSNS